MLDKLSKAAEKAAVYEHDEQTAWVDNWPEVVKAVLREVRRNTARGPLAFYRADDLIEDVLTEKPE